MSGSEHKRPTHSDFAPFLGVELEEFTNKVKEHLGVKQVRIVRMDGEARMVTKDMRMGRANVEAETKDGKTVVTKFTNMG